MFFSEALFSRDTILGKRAYFDSVVNYILRAFYEIIRMSPAGNLSKSYVRGLQRLPSYPTPFSVYILPNIKLKVIRQVKRKLEFVNATVSTKVYRKTLNGTPAIRAL